MAALGLFSGLLLGCALSVAAQVDVSHREASFNGTAYVQLLLTQPLALRNSQIGLSFKSCKGGALFRQEARAGVPGLSLEVRPDGLVLTQTSEGGAKRETTLHSTRLLDNKWHTVEIVDRLGNITLSSPGQGEVQISGTPEVADTTKTTTLTVGGDGYEGCLLEGPSVVLSGRRSHSYGAAWGSCETDCDGCGGCGLHGTCGDHGVCVCQSRFSGAHCEQDHGSPCFVNGLNPCQEGGGCLDKPNGEYECLCGPGRHGRHCELQLCDHACSNGGTCVTDQSGQMRCLCPNGFSGTECDARITVCTLDLCLHGGVCEELPGGGFRCRCDRTGYEGERCEKNSDECLHKPCLNDGTCFDTYGGYVCQCRAGFGGQNCEQNLDECSSNPCRNGTTCKDLIGGYECNCAPGSAECANTCASSPCQNGGTCNEAADAGFNCSCAPGFLGESCQLAACEMRPCLNGGLCKADGCHCSVRHTGIFCEETVTCNYGLCLNGATCNDSVEGFECSCAAGFEGSTCSHNINDCLSSPCQNGATCEDGVATYVCHCVPGFTGSICENRVDGCASAPCNNGATCHSDAVGGHVCQCADGFGGERCERQVDACESTPCLQGGSCNATPNGGYYCECPPGLEGLQCESNMDDCRGKNCPEGHVCVDLVNGHECRCPEGYTGPNCTDDMDYCVNHRCAAGSTCRDGISNYTCLCQPGFQGPLCEDNVDECKVEPNICNHGICIDNKGSYNCFCRPGFSGTHCDLDFDECLSHPCKNGASCTNMVNGYNCTCLPGFTGKDCETNINDCASSPCFNGGTCIDGIASFNCSCLEGIRGEFCEINVDDCESNPCQNGAVCLDGINLYDCECAGTGFEGVHCENNIDDCLDNVCHHGATCIDLVNGFSCSCHGGYTGKQCDMDIHECDSSPCRFNGTCLELSDQSLYLDASNSWRPLLPENFSYDNAEGFKCACPAGTTGEICEVNINECASSPCQHGTCQDLLNAYECKCDKGFTGVHCETDINECEPDPCVQGTCRDLQADYLCECDAGFGGRNCSVELTGCQDPVCLNNGTCHPWLFDETEHRFNCTCPKGFHGKTCSRGTTLSFAGNTSKVSVTTYREEGYDIQFRFRTTLESGQLVEGQGNPSLFFLELVSGRLNLHTSLLNRIEGVFIGSQLNDGKWKHVFLSINASHVVLSALDEQSIYPINSEYIGENSTTTVFPTTRLGGSSNNPLRKANYVGSFVGCMEDVVVNGKWVLPKGMESIASDEDQGDVAQANITGVEAGCQRTEQCEPNPCESGGTCTDLWRTFHCACQRPHLGPTCQFEMIAATFGHENSQEGYVTVNASDEARRIIRQVVSISMFMRTRKPDGVLFHLGAVDSDTVIWAQLYKGELSVHVNLNTTESYPVGGTRLDDGHRHLIEVVRNVTLVEVRINGTEYFRKTISFSSYLNAPVLYLGGKPAPEVSATEAVRAVRQASASPAPLEAAPSHPPPFKGILQDVQLSNGSAILTVQFYPLQEAEVPPPYGEVIFEAAAVLKGVQSDDACRENPCEHQGICNVTWNDFECICPAGYKGKTCDEMEFCQLHECPEQSTCENLDAGFECLAQATFNAAPNDPPLHFQAPANTPDDWWGNPVVSVDFRTTSGGELVSVVLGSDFLRTWVVSNGSSVLLEATVANFTWTAHVGLPTGGNWTRLVVRLKDGHYPELFVESEEPETALETVDLAAWTNLLRKGALTVGGGFRGCLGAVRVSEVLAPFFTSDEVSVSNKSRHWVSSASSKQPPKGCVLCFESECENEGHCHDPREAYECTCLPGFRGLKCEENINECESHNCLNGATCQDHINSYSCLCVPGYTGVTCEFDINECESNPCLNNGTCTDLLAAFQCTCHEDFVGDRCENMRKVTCENRPCFNKAQCENVPRAQSGDNFTCNCREGFEGFHCKQSFCELQQCVNGATCHPEVPACVCLKGYEGKFCELDIDECKSKPCKNHGQCADLVGEFKCNCQDTGFTGATCQEDVDECLEQPDRCGQGTCVNSQGSFQCKCDDDEYCGPSCTVKNPCKTEQCQNRGACMPVCNENQNFTCSCTEGYGGDRCELEPLGKSDGPSGLDLALIITPIICLLVLVGGVSLAVFISLARKKRATRGTYSPSQQEYCNPRLELDNVLKPPPEERLI